MGRCRPELLEMHSNAIKKNETPNVAVQVYNYPWNQEGSSKGIEAKERNPTDGKNLIDGKSGTNHMTGRRMCSEESNMTNCRLHRLYRYCEGAILIKVPARETMIQSC
jgi:hypothetical protein